MKSCGLQCDQAFPSLKIALSSSPVLCSPDFAKRFILQTDASERGVGAVLSQYDENDQDRPVAYFSRKLLPRQQHYSTIEKECLAIKLSVQAFHILDGPHVHDSDRPQEFRVAGPP